MTDTPSRVLAEATDYSSLLDAFRARAAELGITRLEIDDIGGLACGYASKLLAGSPMKTLGRVSLGPLLGALALKLVVVADPAQQRRIAVRIAQKRERAGQSRSPRRQRQPDQPGGEIAPRFDFGSGAII